MVKPQQISENFCHNLIDHLSGMFYKCLNDSKRTIIYVNKGCKNLTGYKPEEIINNKKISFSSIIHVADIKKIRAFYKNNQVSKPQFSIEYRLLTKDGDVKQVRELANKVYDKKNKLLYTEGYIEEITALEGLNTNPSTFSAIQKALNKSSIVSMADLKGKIIYANDLFCKYSKYKLSELKGQDHSIINSGYHPKSYFTTLWKTIIKGEIWRGEICNKAKDGSLYWVDTVISPIYNKNNKIEQFLSIRNIITDRKVIENALQKNEQRLTSLFEGVNDVIYTLSKTGNFLSLNKAFEKITGWKIKNWLGKSFMQLIHPEDLHTTLISFEKALKGVQAETFEVRIKTRSGKYLYAEITPSGLIDNNGVLSTLGVARDVSFRKEAELKLKRIYDTISVKTGMNYFSNLTKYCCENLDVKYACIGLYLPEQNAIQTLSFRSKNKAFDNFTYLLKNTPSDKVVRMEGFNFLNNVQKRFPKDGILKKLTIESFMGYPLVNEDNEVLGIITLMDDKPITDALEKENTLSFVLARTANEISRNTIEKKLKESEEFNKGILSSLTSQIAVLNKNGDIISVNEAWDNFSIQNGETILSRTGVGSNYFKTCANSVKNGDEIAKKAVHGIKSVLKKNMNFFQLEYPCYTENKELWFLLTVSSYHSNSDDTKVVVRHIDITERRKIENALEKSEKNYRDLIENSHDIVFSINPKGKFLFTNKFCQHVLKYSSEELSHLDLFAIIPSDHHGECLQHLKNILAGKKNINIETIFITKNKKHIYVEGNGTPIFLNGKVVGVQSFFRDISERKKAELELIRSEQRYKHVVENINDAIIVRNLKGKTLYANQRFLDLLGLKKKDLDGLRMEDYIAPGWQAETRKQYHNIIYNQDTSEVYEYQGLHNDGTTRWLEDKITLLLEDGKVTGTQAVIRDVTELKKKENDLKKLINELTNRNNEMMQFNYIVSHNLRAPIANIIGLSNLISNENIAQTEGKEIIQHIKNSSAKMDEMIKDLSLVLNTRSNLNAKKEKVLLSDILHGITEILETQIITSKCQIEIHIEPKVNEFYTIKSYIESILFNLISNAIKYRSSQRPLLVKINATYHDNKTIITVSDNGSGINLAENGAYIFGLYKRFNFDVEGKGLGLHMTKAQVEALGGKITINSELNKGTEFKIEFNN